MRQIIRIYSQSKRKDSFQFWFRVIQKVFKPEKEYWYCLFSGFIDPIFIPLFPYSNFLFNMQIPLRKLCEIFNCIFIVSHRAKLYKLRNKDVHGITHATEDYLCAKGVLIRELVRKMCFLNPYALISNPFSFKTWKLKSHIKVEFHDLVRASGYSSNCFEIFS